jgi:transaldolase
VASFFVSRIDSDVDPLLARAAREGGERGEAAKALIGRTAVASARAAYAEFKRIFGSNRFAALSAEGARPQRLLWASTSTKDPAASDTLYVHGLGAPLTVNTMPDETLRAFADHGEVGPPMPADGGDAEETLAAFAEAGVDADALAAQLQTDGAASFVSAWKDLLGVVDAKAGAVAG